MSAVSLSLCRRSRPKCPKWQSDLGRKVSHTNRGSALTAPSAPTVPRARVSAGAHVWLSAGCVWAAAGRASDLVACYFFQKQLGQLGHMGQSQ